MVAACLIAGPCQAQAGRGAEGARPRPSIDLEVKPDTGVSLKDLVADQAEDQRTVNGCKCCSTIGGDSGGSGAGATGATIGGGTGGGGTGGGGTGGLPLPSTTPPSIPTCLAGQQLVILGGVPRCI
jgi:hypothetical protein